MSESLGTATSPLSTSHVGSLIDQIELILTSPADFTSSTSQLTLPPLLQRLFDYDGSDVEVEKRGRIERWCSELQDATRAAYARETIVEFLDEIETWGDWDWDSHSEEVELKRRRADEIKCSLGALPIEWLKSRVQGRHHIGDVD